MLGLMSQKQLLISSLIEHSSQYHGNTEIVERTPNGIVNRITYKNINIRLIILNDIVLW